MSRYVEEDKDYAPALAISARLAPEGGGVANPCTFRWSNQHAFPQREILVLVHGFGNHLREAQDRYMAFRSGQETWLPKADVDRLESMLGDAFWPGDANWAGPLDKFDFMVYPHAIGNAVQSAEALGDYLLSRTDVQSLNFIGHSMGCRVILEAIKYMQGKAGEKVIDKVCLMAAAVPVKMISPPDGQLLEAIRTPKHVRIFYSPDDAVLSMAFRAGQTLRGGEEGGFPVAVGHAGDAPLSPGQVDRELITGADHGDYWGTESNAPSRLAAGRITEFFGVGRNFRTLSAQPMAPVRPDPPQRQIGTLRRYGRP